MAKTAIVTTSIGARPESYRDWATAGDLIVAGDQNAPASLRDFLSEVGGLYLTPERQTKDYPFSDIIGWRNIQRRNCAIMYALEQKYDVIITVDDDNYPVGGARQFRDGHIAALAIQDTPITYASPTNFLNTGIFCTPMFHQRGVPYGIQTHITRPRTTDRPRIVVSQAQVLGDPDCDAIERMCNAPEVQAVVANVIISPGTYAAFNSQATVWAGDWAPVMAVLPGLGRYDDIFASYVFHRLARTYNVALHVGAPAVVQKRNAHDLVKDLKAELWGMSNVFTFCDELDRAYISADMPLVVAYSELMVAAAAVLPPDTIEFARIWAKHWREVL